MKFEKFIDVESSNYKKIIHLMKLGCVHQTERRDSGRIEILMVIYCGITEILLIWSFYSWRFDPDKLANIAHHATLLNNILFITYHCNVTKWDNFNYQIKSLEQSYNYGSPSMSEFGKQLVKGNESFVNILYMAILSGPMFALVNVAVFSIMEKYVWGAEFILLYPVYIPGLNNWMIYIPILVWQYSLIIMIGLNVFAYLGYTFLVYSYIFMQFEILETALATNNNRVEEKMNHFVTQTTTKREKKIIKDKITSECIQDCVKHHLYIIRYFENIRDSFRLPYFLITCVGVVIFVSVGFTSMSANQALRFKFYGIFLVQFLYMYAFYWVGQEIADKSQSIRKRIVYNMEWWDLPKSSQTSIRLMMVRTMRPLSLETSTGQKIDLMFYMDIIKGAYSYFNVMNSN